MGTTRDIFLENEGIINMVFSHFTFQTQVDKIDKLCSFFWTSLRVIIESLPTIYPCNSKCYSKADFYLIISFGLFGLVTS
jgi:hypothetical protein